MNEYLPHHFHKYLLSVSREPVNPNLCMYCDLFFQHVTNATTPEYKRKNQSYPHYVLEGPGNNKARYPHWPKLSDVLEAAKKGCHVCRCFAAQLNAREIRLIEENTAQLHLLEVHGCIRLLYPSSPSHWPGLKVELIYYVPATWYTRADHNPGASRKAVRKGTSFFAPLLLTQTKETDCIDGVQLETFDSYWDLSAKWIEACVKTHESCKHPLLPAELRPSRLIYLGVKDDFSDIRLCSDANEISAANYVTLSHTWGQSGLARSSKLLKSSGFEASIPFYELPPTFQDAIRVARRFRQFGVGYLWIDALCIFQDDAEDFAKEGPKMFDIYTNSFCTLAASTGVDSSSGLFPHSDSFIHHACSLQTGPESCFGSQRFQLRSDDVLGDRVRHGTIRSRGWCYQELTLSRRVLYFAPGRIAWECGQSCSTSEEPNTDIRNQESLWIYSPFKTKEMLPLMKRIDDIDDLNPVTIEVNGRWSEAIRNYTYMDLTNPSDRLIAIGGVAKQLHRVMEGRSEYYAGLWSQFIHIELIWTVKRPQERRSGVDRPYRGPSWSWCSADGPIYNHRINLEGMESNEPLVQITAELHYEGEDSFGQLQLDMREDSAILHVKGPVFAATLGPRGTKYPSFARCKIHVDGQMVENSSVHLDFAISGPDAVRAEPGYCSDSEFGIRIENIVMAQEVKTTYQFGEKPSLGCEHVTMTSLCRKLIDTKLLTEGEKEWTNDYHKEIWEKTAGFFNSDQRTSNWLKRECPPL